MRKPILLSLLVIGLLVTITTNVIGKHNLNYINNKKIIKLNERTNFLFGYYFNYIITEKGKVYTISTTISRNTKLEQIIRENGGVNNILGLYSADNHNILIFKNGKVYVWGRNNYGQLGTGDTTYYINTPTENPKLENIIKQNGGTSNIYGLFTGLEHYILIFKNGKVFVWGWNSMGQLGIGNVPFYVKEPTRNTDLEQIIKENGGIKNIYNLYVGAHHNILIFKNGKVYGWGYNDDSELGTGGWANRYKPIEHKLLEEVIQQNGGIQNIQGLYIGGLHNILIFKNGKVYVWGRNDDGQTGLGNTKQRITVPTENKYIENIIQQNGGINQIYRIFACYLHNILIFKNGKVYGWGNNKYGQLAMGYTPIIDKPIEDKTLENIIKQNGGVNNIQTLYTGLFDNILIFKNGKIYVWGDNNMGELGLGDKNKKPRPIRNTKLEKIIQQNGIPFYKDNTIVKVTCII